MWLKIILAFFVYNTIKSKRLVINTTCLELSDPSNQKFRLTCVNSSDYHCLLDRDSINEYEVCRKWKWIAAGKCAYFNTYEEGNIDGRPCINSTDFVCPKDLHSSKENTKYPACYIKIITSTKATKLSSYEVTSESTTVLLKEVSSDGIASLISDTSNSDKQYDIARMTSAVVFGVFVPVLLIAAIVFICRKRESVALRHKPERKNEDIESKVPQKANENGSTRKNEINDGTLQRKESENNLDEDAEQEHLMKIENFSTREIGNVNDDEKLVMQSTPRILEKQ